MNQTFVLVLSSAAVGALISSLIMVIGQVLERRAKRRELLFTKAIEMGQANVELLKETADRGRNSVALRPLVVYVRWHYKQLCSLYDSGRLTPGMEERYSSEIRDLDI
jgi:hypothetical protein